MTKPLDFEPGKKGPITQMFEEMSKAQLVDQHGNPIPCQAGPKLTYESLAEAMKVLKTYQDTGVDE